MAISLSSDLIADVMRMADPARLTAATAKLQSLQPPGQSHEGFANVIEQTGTTLPLSERATALHQMAKATAPEPYVEFERMVLRNLFESLLPREESGAFGSGPSAGAWRSLAADQLAGLYAGTGGIGIAAELSSDAGGNGETQWPYFNTRKIEAFTG